MTSGGEVPPYGFIFILHPLSFMPDILAELHWRDLIHQTTDNANLQAWLKERSRTIYVGFDPTSDGIHVGNLVAVMLLRRFQQAGHRPIALVGGATGMIGDPSGKSDERNLLSVEVLRATWPAWKNNCGVSSISTAVRP